MKRVVLRRWQLALAEFILSAPLPSEFLWAGKTGWKTVWLLRYVRRDNRRTRCPVSTQESSPVRPKLEGFGHDPENSLGIEEIIRLLVLGRDLRGGLELLIGQNSFRDFIF